MDKRALAVIGGLLVVSQLVAGLDLWSFVRWGIVAQDAPVAGTPRLVAGVSARRFGPTGRQLDIAVRGQGRYPTTAAHEGPTQLVSAYRISPTATIETDDGEAIVVDCDWRTQVLAERFCQATLPELPDGDHTLKVHVDSPMPAPVELSLPLPVYQPAHAHVLTDRPIYAPGDRLQARAVTVSAASLTPLSGRPGRWTLSSDTHTLLEESATTDAWGVALLDVDLPETLSRRPLTLRWTTGAAQAEQVVEVDTLVMPWLEVDGTASQPWYAPGEVPQIDGVVRSIDGRAVGHATVTWQVEAPADWLVPTDWQMSQELRTDALGRFELALSPIPDDLPGHRSLDLRFDVVGPSGDAVHTTVPLRVSPEPLRIRGLTESGGLLAHRANRLYLLVTTPDGEPLRDTALTVSSALDPLTPTQEARTDEDGVAAVRLDLGSPLALPRAEPPRRDGGVERPVFRLVDGANALDGQALSLAERDVLVGALSDLDPACGTLVEATGRLDLQLSARGHRIHVVTPDQTPLQACLSRVLTQRPWPVASGLWTVTLGLQPEPGRLRMALVFDETRDKAVDMALRRGVHHTHACAQAPGPVGTVQWLVRQGSDQLEIDADLPACVRAAWPPLQLLSPAPHTRQGVARLEALAPTIAQERAPAPRVDWGWVVRVDAGGRSGSWRVNVSTASTPWARAIDPVVRAGEVLEFAATVTDNADDWTILEGPGGWRQTCARAGAQAESDADCPPSVDSGWRFVPPSDRPGLYRLYGESGRSGPLVVVRPPEGKGMLALSTDAATYRPGEQARIRLQTDEAALVSLVGVDDRLRAHAPLPGGQELVRAFFGLQKGTVFGEWSVADVFLGNVTGEHAVRAVLSRAAGPETHGGEPAWPPALAAGGHDSHAELWQESARLIRHLRAALRASPDTPLTYDDVLGMSEDIVEQHHLTDPYGRPLDLRRLPDRHQLAADPRVLIGDATRFAEGLPEWAEWLEETTP